MSPTPWYVREFTGRKLVFNVMWVPSSSPVHALRLTTPRSFYLGHIGLFAYGWNKQVRRLPSSCSELTMQASDPRLAALNGLKFSVWVSRGAGLCLGVDGLLLILPGASRVLRRRMVLMIRRCQF